MNADNSEKTVFALQKADKRSVEVMLPGAHVYRFGIRDQQGENGETIFLSNAVEENTAQFFADPAGKKRYTLDDLTARLDRTP